MFLIHNQAQDAELLAGALVAACRLPGGWCSPLQVQWLEGLFTKLLGFHGDFATLPPALPIVVRQRLPTRAQRLELLELMVSLEMLCNPIPAELCDSVEQWAQLLAIESKALLVVRDLAKQHHDSATRHWYRHSWIGAQAMAEPEMIHQLQAHGTMALALTFEPDVAEAERWQQLQGCPMGSLGRCTHDLLVRVGHGFAGEPGATNSSLAIHDWVHAITGFSIDPLGEIVLAAYIAAAAGTSETMLAFLGTISIFETGLLHYNTAQSKGGVSEELPRFGGALSQPGAIAQVARAIEAGKKCPVDPIRDVDYFAIADQPIGDIRRRWQLPAHGLAAATDDDPLASALM